MSRAMADDHVLTTRDENGVALLQLNRPPMNPLSQAMLAAIGAAATEVAGDPSVKAVVITGSDRALAAGADIDEFGDQATRASHRRRVPRRVRRDRRDPASGHRRGAGLCVGWRARARDGVRSARRR